MPKHVLVLAELWRSTAEMTGVPALAFYGGIAALGGVLLWQRRRHEELWTKFRDRALPSPWRGRSHGAVYRWMVYTLSPAFLLTVGMFGFVGSIASGSVWK